MFRHVDGRARLLIRPLFSAVLIAVLMAPALGASARDPEANKVLEFETMAPVQPPFVGPVNPVRGFGGGGLPWVIASANGELAANGAIEVHVRGLVLDPALVPAPLGGTNPVAMMDVFVSCLTKTHPRDPGEAARVTQGPFPASSTGDMDAEGSVTLPRPCVAPVILVTTPAPAARWLAATGVGM